MGSFAVKDVPVLCSVLSQESRDRARPTRMYFERWGLLTPPSGKADVLEGYVSLLSHTDTIPRAYEACNNRHTGVLACKKLSLDSTRHGDIGWTQLRVARVLCHLW